MPLSKVRREKIREDIMSELEHSVGTYPKPHEELLANVSNVLVDRIVNLTQRLELLEGN